MAQKDNWRKREGVVYSTAQDFSYETNEEAEVADIQPSEQKLKVLLDKKQRAGKTVTLVENFVGSEESLKELGKRLKTACGVGGSAKDGVIIIQGDFRDKIMQMLAQWGYNAKRVGG